MPYQFQISPDGLYGVRDLYNSDVPKQVDLKEGFKFFTPVGFRVALHGGWLNPRGIFAPNMTLGYDNITLSTLGFNRGSLLGNVVDIAYSFGWVNFTYQQQYTKYVLNTHPQVHKTLIISLSAENVTKLSLLRMLQVCKEYSRIFPGIRFQVNYITTETDNSTVTSKIVYSEKFRNVSGVNILVHRLTYKVTLP